MGWKPKTPLERLAQSKRNKRGEKDKPKVRKPEEKKPKKKVTVDPDVNRHHAMLMWGRRMGWRGDFRPGEVVPVHEFVFSEADFWDVEQLRKLTQEKEEKEEPEKDPREEWAERWLKENS